MNICGIVAEYNPFHNGHAYHIEATRRRLGVDTAIVCCMSGSWVQRGEAALLPKHTRAAAALQCGADLVLELPSPYALLSAEGFGESAVHILLGLRVLTHLSFGAEDDRLEDLLEIAGVLLEHRTVQQTLTELKSGVSYAAARERALFSVIREKADLIRSPNNILAVEYLKALIKAGSSVRPVAVARRGAGHDSPEAGDGYASASYIRKALQSGQGRADVAHLMPQLSSAYLGLAIQSGQVADPQRLEALMLSALWRETPESLARLGDIAEGLEHRLHAAIRGSRDMAGIVRAAKTRRYPEARIRRLLARAFLGITAEDTALPPPYARVLGATPRGRQVLRLAAGETDIPIITKPAHVTGISPRALRVFQLESLAADLHHLSLPAWRDFAPGSDWRTGVVFMAGENA